VEGLYHILKDSHPLDHAKLTQLDLALLKSSAIAQAIEKYVMRNLKLSTDLTGKPSNIKDDKYTMN